MNYYIDFDNTLYNTSKLTKDIFYSIASFIAKEKNLNKDMLFKECFTNFSNEHLTDIYKFSTDFSHKYNIDGNMVINIINKIISNGDIYVFNDCIPFIEKLKSYGHKKYILSYSQNMQYQSLKIAGSNLMSLFDGIYISSIPKYELDLNYQNGIFIDDNPNDLIGLYSKNPIEVIRLRRDENKYSIIEINNDNIKEYKNLGGLVCKEKK